jgi:hypothetical protein
VRKHWPTGVALVGVVISAIYWIATHTVQIKGP